MITFAAGVAVGAAFSKLWIAAFNYVKAKVVAAPAAAKVVADVAPVVAKVEAVVAPVAAAAEAKVEAATDAK